MALLEVMKMTLADLQYIVNNHNGAIGSSGTGSGPQCVSTTVHCCVSPPPTVQVQTATTSESPSGYKLVMGDCEFAIGLETT